MRKYVIKGGTWFRRDVRISSRDQACFGCGFTISKGEFYINDKLERVSNKYGRHLNTGGTPVEIMIQLSWHLGCAPLNRHDCTIQLEEAFKQNAKDNPKRIEEVK